MYRLKFKPQFLAFRTAVSLIQQEPGVTISLNLTRFLFHMVEANYVTYCYFNFISPKSENRIPKTI
jgi:hypothetical protein